LAVSSAVPARAAKAAELDAAGFRSGERFFGKAAIRGRRPSSARHSWPLGGFPGAASA